MDPEALCLTDIIKTMSKALQLTGLAGQSHRK